MGTSRRSIIFTVLVLLCPSVYAQAGSATQGAASQTAASQIASSKVAVNIESQPLRTALRAFGEQTGLQVLIRSEDIPKGDVMTPRVAGEFSVQEALHRLLANTGLEYEFVNKHTVRISNAKPHPLHEKAGGVKSSQTVPDSKGSNDKSKNERETLSSTESESSKEQLAPILVTGTYLHDVQPITPVTTITQADLINQGYTTLASAVLDLPQNFQGGGASPSSNVVNKLGGSGAAENTTFASGVNLLGLGGEATLVLLNGRRLAPTAEGDSVDISQIPLSVIDRVDILTDGASALYGSDAVAGVVNIITKRDYSGFEVGARMTDISKGKAPGSGADIVGGASWDGGGYIASADYQKDNSLFASDRSFSATLPNPWALTPQDDSIHLYGSVHQSFTDRLTFYTDALFAHRDFEAITHFGGLFGNPTPGSDYGTTKQYSISPEFDYAISSNWNAALVGQWSKEQDVANANSPPQGTFTTPISYQVNSIEPRADGKLFALPGGAVRVAIGAQVREESINETQIAPGNSPPSHIDGSRHVTSAYGELMIPIIDRDNAMRFAQELRVDLSGRYDHYSDFGGTSNPKFGISWSPTYDLTLHGTYGRSFQAPTLYELALPPGPLLISPSADPNSPTGSSLAALEYYSPNTSLQPQTAKTLNAGFTYQPSYLSGLKLEASYFDIHFDNEIVNLSGAGVCVVAYYCTVHDETTLGSFFQRDPSLAEVETLLNTRTVYNFAGGNYAPAPYTASDIKAIVNYGLANAASTRIRGIDLTPRYLGPVTPYGRFRADLSALYYIKYLQSVTASSPPNSIDNTFANPLRLRVKANVGWQRNDWAANVRVNYANSYTNTAASSCATSGTLSGCPPISSWLTFDLGLSYAVPNEESSSWLRGVRVAVIVNNVFNREPPVANIPVLNYGYDSVNADPLLRDVSLTFTKRFGSGESR